MVFHVVGIIPDQKTVLDSERRARIKQDEFLRERRQARKYSTVETVIVIVLGIVVVGLVLFVLSNYL